MVAPALAALMALEGSSAHREVEFQYASPASEAAGELTAGTPQCKVLAVSTTSRFLPCPSHPRPPA